MPADMPFMILTLLPWNVQKRKIFFIAWCYRNEDSPKTDSYFERGLYFTEVFKLIFLYSSLLFNYWYIGNILFIAPASIHYGRVGRTDHCQWLLKAINLRYIVTHRCYLT